MLTRHSLLDKSYIPDDNLRANSGGEESDTESNFDKVSVFFLEKIEFDLILLQFSDCC